MIMGTLIDLALTHGPHGRMPPFVGALVALVLTASSVNAATGWTGPRLVGPPGYCSDVTAAIDASGGYHVVTECDGRIRYSSSEADGTWSTTYFAHPLSQSEHQPQLAIDGGVAYVAYTREKFAGCGFDWAGVYYRTRTLPGRTWSAARPLGRAGDHLQSLRVVDGTIHATVDQSDVRYQVSYETSTSETLHRYPLSDAIGLTSLRVGSDGLARIVYEGARSLRYAVFNGSGFTRSSIPGTTSEDRRPLLVLESGNKAHVVWTHAPGPGCAEGSGNPDLDGTYYATNRTGAWTAIAFRRVTTDLGVKSLTVDAGTGRVHVLVGGESGLRHYTDTATGPWSVLKLSSAIVTSCAIRLDPATGTLLAVYARASDEKISASIYAFTKP